MTQKPSTRAGQLAVANSSRKELVPGGDGNPGEDGKRIQLPEERGAWLRRVFLQIVGLNFFGVFVWACSCQLAVPLIVGFLLGESCLVAIGIALGPGLFLKRALFGYAIALGWVLALLLVPLALSLGSPDGAPNWIGVVGGLPIFLVGLQLPLWAMRFRFHWRLVIQSDEREAAFSLADYMAAFMIVGVAMASLAGCTAGFRLGPREQADLLLRLLAGSLLTGSFLILPVVFFLLDASRARPRFVPCLFCALVVCAGGLGLWNELPAEYGNGPYSWIVGTLQTSLGALAAMMPVLLMCRSKGMRLVVSGERTAEIEYLASAPSDHSGRISGDQGRQSRDPFQD